MVRLLLILALLFLPVYSWSADDTPPMPDKKVRCGECGMYVANFPTWIAALKFPDGKVEYFDGPKEMFKRLFALTGPDNRPVAFVTDYYSAKLIRAREASFVMGGDVIGPMGVDLVPLSSQKEALGFKRDHGAKAVLGFSDVTEETIKELR